MENFSVDIGKLQVAIQEKADVLLNEITEDNLKYFSSEIKKVAESILDEYIFKIYDIYTEGALKIEDTDHLLAFTDYTNGFQGLMDNWKNLHPIIIKQETVTLPLEPQMRTQKIAANHVAVGGTIIATGLLIFSNVWVALAVELLTVAITYYKIQERKNYENDFEFQKQKYQIEIQKKKSELIQGLTNDLELWLSNAANEANSILKQLGL